MEDTNFAELTKTALQDLLKEQGRKITGNKADLIERLSDGHDSNNFVDDSALETKDGDEDGAYKPPTEEVPPVARRNSEEPDESDDESVS